MAKAQPGQLDADELDRLEDGYVSGATGMGIVVGKIFGHLRYLEGELAKARSDPGHVAAAPGVI